MTDSGQRISLALASPRRVRGQLIDLTHQLPKDAPPHVLTLWNNADNAVRRFILSLERLER